MTTKHVHREEIKKEKVNVECSTISIVQHTNDGSEINEMSLSTTEFVDNIFYFESC